VPIKVPDVADVHTSLDEGYPPGDMNDYVRSAVSGTYMTLAAEGLSLPAEVESIYDVHVQIFHRGEKYAKIPAAMIEQLLGRVKLRERGFALSTDGADIFEAGPFPSAIAKAVVEELGLGLTLTWRDYDPLVDDDPIPVVF